MLAERLKSGGSAALFAKVVGLLAEIQVYLQVRSVYLHNLIFICESTGFTCKRVILFAKASAPPPAPPPFTQIPTKAVSDQPHRVYNNRY